MLNLFQRAHPLVSGSQKHSPELSCLGYCGFEDCPVTVTVTLESEEDLKATVDFQGGMCVHNKMEIKRRPVRAEERKVLGENLQTQLPEQCIWRK